jgi:hypothetical protein
MNAKIKANVPLKHVPNAHNYVVKYCTICQCDISILDGSKIYRVSFEHNGKVKSTWINEHQIIN